MPNEYERLGAAYIAWGYHGGLKPSDVVFVAERSEEPIGIVRRSVEHGATMLRGMWVAPAEQRQGIGSALLREFVRDLDDRECIGVPFAHLGEFYGCGGFAMIDESEAPEFIRERMTQYRVEGLEVLFMRRAAGKE